MVVNRKFEIGVVSIILVILLESFVFNIFKDLFDNRRTSSIISISYAVSLIFICTLLFCSKKKSIQITVLDILLICYFIFTTFGNGAFSTIEHLGDIALVLLYISIRNINKLNYKILYIGILSSCCSLSILGYLQYIHLLPVPNESFKVLGPFYNPSQYAGLLSLFLSIQIAALTICKKRSSKYITLFIILSTLPVFIISGSRAAYIALTISILYIFFSKYKSKFQGLPVFKKYIFITILFVAFIQLCFSFYNMRPDSVKGRMLIWKVSSNMILDAPIGGLGRNGFEANYMNYQSEYFKHSKGSESEKHFAGNVTSAYNEPLRIVIEHGFIGLTLYLLILFMIFFRVKENDICSNAARATVLSYILFGLFSYPNKNYPLQIVAIIALACLSNRQTGGIYKMQFRTAWRLTLYKLYSALFIFLFIFNIIRYHISYTQFQAILQQPTSVSFTKLRTLESILGNDYLFLLNSCILERNISRADIILIKLNKAILLSSSNTLHQMKGDCLVRLARYKEAEQAYWTAHYMAPIRQLARAKLAHLYFKTHRLKEAKAMASSILNEKVKVYGFDTYKIHYEMKEIIRFVDKSSTID